MSDQDKDLFRKLVRSEKEHIEVMTTSNSTIVILTAVAVDPGKNLINKISCKHGVPIGGYVYNSQYEHYVLNCHDYVPLATVPVSMTLRMRGCTNWMVRVPLSEAVIKRFLSAEQKKLIRQFKVRYQEPDFKVHFIQLTDPNG